MSSKEELKNPGLTATFIVRIEDVTSKVNDQVTEGMNEEEAVLIVYLFDSHYSFNNEPGKDSPEFKEYVEKQNIDLNVPLVGYAIGFPPIENDPGGIYVQGDYNLDDQILVCKSLLPVPMLKSDAPDKCQI